MRAHIFYHQDVDGVVSAAMLGKLYTDNDYSKVAFGMTGVNYNETDWATQDLKKRSIQYDKPADILYIADFMYNPTTDFWFDHHSFKEEEIPKEFKGYYKSGIPSCAQVIFDYPDRDRFKDEDLMLKMVKEVNLVDNAQYTSVDQVYDPTTWAPKFRLAFMEQGNEEFQNELIRMMIFDRTTFYKLADGHIPWSIEWRAQRVKAKLKSGLEATKKVAQMENGVVFYTSPSYEKCDRYFPYKIFPEAKYSCYLNDYTWSKKGVHIAVACNPFIPAYEHHNIKSICEKYGGGGHDAVGGIFVETMEQATQIQKEIIEKLSSPIVQELKEDCNNSK